MELLKRKKKNENWFEIKFKKGWVGGKLIKILFIYK